MMSEWWRKHGFSHWSYALLAMLSAFVWWRMLVR